MIGDRKGQERLEDRPVRRMMSEIVPDRHGSLWQFRIRTDRVRPGVISSTGRGRVHSGAEDTPKVRDREASNAMIWVFLFTRA